MRDGRGLVGEDMTGDLRLKMKSRGKDVTPRE
jgi:hypothetical protein